MNSYPVFPPRAHMHTPRSVVPAQPYSSPVARSGDWVWLQNAKRGREGSKTQRVLLVLLGSARPDAERGCASRRAGRAGSGVSNRRYCRGRLRPMKSRQELMARLRGGQPGLLSPAQSCRFSPPPQLCSDLFPFLEVINSLWFICKLWEN